MTSYYAGDAIPEDHCGCDGSCMRCTVSRGFRKRAWQQNLFEDYEDYVDEEWDH